jgi:hypothetical protein
LTALLEPWEIRAIAAIAEEELEKERVRTAIVSPDKWLERAEALRQTAARDDAAFRKSLFHHARRLGIHTPPVPRTSQRLADDGHIVASVEHSRRWLRIILLVARLPTTHPWRQQHRDLITIPMTDARSDQTEWMPGDAECYERLHLLEVAANQIIVNGELVEAPREITQPAEAPTPAGATPAGLAATLAAARRRLA